MEWASQHEKELLKNWDLASHSQAPKKIAPLDGELLRRGLVSDVKRITRRATTLEPRGSRWARHEKSLNG
jgi:hypothetical protein